MFDAKVYVDDIDADIVAVFCDIQENYLEIVAVLHVHVS